MKIRIALYGSNGHQQCDLLREAHPLAEVVAVSGVSIPESPIVTPKIYASLDELLADPEIDLVSLCSPNRARQAEESIRCLKAGKHVLAEKPAALSEDDLDAILEAAQASGRSFREMGGTIFDATYWAMRQIIQRGDLGEIVQAFAQKSYPYFPERPQDEALDGGLFLQVGIHAARMIEHVCGLKISSLSRIETGLGNPKSGNLRMASAFQGTLENGGIVSAIANYLNPRGTGHWGNETLRIFGTQGMIEATDAGTRTRLILGERDLGPICGEPFGASYLTSYARHLLGQGAMPLSLEDELHPLRAILRARPLTGAHA